MKVSNSTPTTVKLHRMTGNNPWIKFPIFLCIITAWQWLHVLPSTGLHMQKTLNTDEMPQSLNSLMVLTHCNHTETWLDAEQVAVTAAPKAASWSDQGFSFQFPPIDQNIHV